MTLVLPIDSDFYEILYTTTHVDSLIRYRRGLDSQGEVVDYDHLPTHIQTKIRRSLKRELDKLNGSESISEDHRTAL